MSAYTKTEEIKVGAGDRPLDAWLRLGILWLMAIPVVLFMFSGQDQKEFLRLSVMPEVPRVGEPLQVTLQLVNTQPEAREIKYNLYSNGGSVLDGTASLAPGQSQQYRYITEAGAEIGRQTTFLAKASLGGEAMEKSRSLPPYPPQIWSSFVSFASFSTSMMSSMSTAIYYKDYFGGGIGANLGLFMVASLLFLSIFQEVTYPMVKDNRTHLLTRLHGRFHELVVLLAIVFVGIVYTIVMLKM
ncbi:MAG: hypothetical protein EXR50_05825 [Dehalococcoidia bacterium]|nr:hypothetical protein [Dehalococcoidia bacterium]